VLGEAGALARRHGQRLTSHPPHFVKLASREEELVATGLANIELHSRLFDLLGFQPSHWNKINIHVRVLAVTGVTARPSPCVRHESGFQQHAPIACAAQVGGVYGNKAKAMARFARAFDRLSSACRARLTVENDDRPSSYSVVDLMALHGMTGIPITFDFHHHRFCAGGQSQEEALLTAVATWPQGAPRFGTRRDQFLRRAAAGAGLTSASLPIHCHACRHPSGGSLVGVTRVPCAQQAAPLRPLCICVRPSPPAWEGGRRGRDD
jgi:hypothetical protein